MKITNLNAKETGIALQKLISSSDEIWWAVAWATETKVFENLYQHREKIRNLIIGTDFAHTCPKLLRRLMEVETVHIKVSDSGKTFHPKIYCFTKGNKVTAIVGSSNFTNGGIIKNDESNLMLEGEATDQTLKEIMHSIEKWWKAGIRISSEFIESYELRHEANKRYQAKMQKPIAIYTPTKKSAHPQLLNTDWSNFISELRNGADKNLEGRVRQLQFARQLFSEVSEFNQMSDLERKAIAGIIGRKEIIGTRLEKHNWAWFGSMDGAGVFKKLVGRNSSRLSAALDAIPLTGEISEGDFEIFISEFKSAFVGEKRSGGVSTASRLLAMKRPDYFVCIDTKNKDFISADFGFTKSSLTLDTYWNQVVEPIMLAKWWNVGRPKGEEGLIWDGRAALLDAIYYEPHR